MGFRFQRRIRIAPGVSLNLGKTGASVSVGPRGAKMTFGKRGVKSSVGIPGTGMRYETPYSGSRRVTPDDGGGALSVLVVLAIVSGLVAYLGYQIYKADSRSNVGPVMILGGAALSIVFFLFSLVFSGPSDPSPKSYSSIRASSPDSSWNRYLRELANASQAFYDFVREVNRSTRCRNILKGLPGLDCVDGGTFSVNPRLGLLVFCDIRDCFRELGHPLDQLQNLEGIGFCMLVCLLVSKGFDVSRFFDRKTQLELSKIVGNVVKDVTAEMDIAGHEEEFRFSVIFGVANGESDLVQRYSSLMYRWASLIAKADGVVSEEESEVLAAIMDMPQRSGGHVVVKDASVPKSIGAMPVLQDQDGSERAEQRRNSKAQLKEVLASLDALVGLGPVKLEVKKLANFIEIQSKRVRSGLKAAPISYHCIFTGNPGTGKTTVARILADIYREMGVVKKGHLVETDRSGLVGEYVGQTAVKTNKIIDSALDGVLFIDEAYMLVQGGERDYGREAIATLLKRMEDDRDRLVVILAGYTDEMKQFVDSNPGLQSRFSRNIEFPDYTASELAEIFLIRAEKSQYTCDSDVRASIVQIMERAVINKDRNFGNARYVRNLFENAIQRQAVRLSTVAPLTTEMLSELTLHDLGFAYGE